VIRSSNRPYPSRIPSWTEQRSNALTCRLKCAAPKRNAQAQSDIPGQSAVTHRCLTLGPAGRRRSSRRRLKLASLTPISRRSKERVHDLGRTDEFRVDPWSISLDVPKEMIMYLPPRWEGR
jgi:hypothetical protein